MARGYTKRTLRQTLIRQRSMRPDKLLLHRFATWVLPTFSAKTWFAFRQRLTSIYETTRCCFYACWMRCIYKLSQVYSKLPLRNKWWMINFYFSANSCIRQRESAEVIDSWLLREGSVELSRFIFVFETKFERKMRHSGFSNSHRANDWLNGLYEYRGCGQK